MSISLLTFRIGEFSCTPISDGGSPFPAALLLSNLSDEERAQVLSANNMPSDQIVCDYTCLLIRTPTNTLLLDTGGGNLVRSGGKLLQNLERARARAGDIDTVILTHAHPDHIAGILTVEGKPGVRRLGEQMAEALVAAHERGVVHRDLKPANLKLTPDGRLKILDFGIAKLLLSPLKATEAPTLTDTNAAELGQTDPALSVSLLTQGAVVGTVPYMSPEQLRGGVVDALSDVYSSGVVLYEMCCGQLPFPHTDYRRLAEAILNEAPVSPSKIAPISPRLQAIILKALQKDSRRRYQSAKELLADLRRLAPARQQRASKVIDSIAVLPFENQNVATEYLGEGITENLIHSLSELPSMKKVIARSSVFRYKGRQVSPEDVGRELNVRAVLIGRVVQKGDTISITAELVDSTDARHLWGGQYRRNLTVVTEVQQEIADDIAEKLKLRFTMRRRKAAACKVNPEAYRSYLKGRYFWNKRPAQGMVHKAIEHFEQATEHDPKFALAYVGLADCYNALGRWESGAMSPRSAFPQAKAAASRALRLDSSLAEAHSALAYVSMHYDWEWATAGEGFQRALRLNPNSSHAHHWYAHYLIGMGRIEEALAESFRILELDPLDVIINAHLAWHYCLAHQFPDAVDASKKTLELEPHSHLGYFFLGWAYEQMRMLSQAVEALEKSLALSGGNAVMKAALGHAYALAGDHTAALRVIQELKELSKTTLAWAKLARGEILAGTSRFYKTRPAA